MLARKKKPQSWLKKKPEGFTLLARITQVFDESQTLADAFQKVNELLAVQVHFVSSGFYAYNQTTAYFTLRFSGGSQDVFGKHPELTPADCQLTQMAAAEVGIVNVAVALADQGAPSRLEQTCRAQAIRTLLYLPLSFHDRLFGMLLFASNYIQHLTSEETAFFTVFTQHLSRVLEKAVLSDRFESLKLVNTFPLPKSEERYRVLFENASDAIVIFDFATQQILEVNRQTENLVGYARPELLAMNISDFRIRKAEKGLSTGLLRSVVKRKSVNLRERQIRRQDGRFVWIEINAAAVDYQGKQVVLAIIRDISQRKQLELENAVIDAINKALISSQNVQAVAAAIGQNLRHVFQFEWMDILLPGSTPQKLRLFVSLNVAKNISDLEEQEYVQEGTTIKTVFRTGKPVIVNYREKGVNRSIPELFGQQLQTSLFFPLEYQEKVLGVLHFGSYQADSFAGRQLDFLKRIAPQLAIAIENTLLFRQLNEESVVYKHLIENVNELVFQVDPKGQIMFVNHRVQAILGYTPDEITGTNFFSYVFPEDLEEAKAAFRLALRHEQPLSGEFRAFHKDSTVLTISIYVRPIFEDGHAVGMQGIIQDITPPPNRFMALRNGLHELIGRSHRMQEIYQLIMSVAETDSTVLIHGESGTGKELIAQAIHAYSHRKNKPFIVLNCAAYSEHLLESELFGHERGAFTGAHRRKLGRFELAKGGTIFLDEVGEIPLHSQLLLLRVIQNKTFERVGGEKTLTADVRIVAATNKKLVEAMKTGRFREDLYYRLNVIAVEVPPLRERKEDIPYLVEHFLKKYAASTGKQMLKCSQSTMERLMQHEWYGNVRELENAIERAVVMASGPVITPGDLPPTLQLREDLLSDRQVGVTDPASLYDHEKQLILTTLQATNWNKYQAAKLLGITRSTLYSKIEKYCLTDSRASETPVV